MWNQCSYTSTHTLMQISDLAIADYSAESVAIVATRTCFQRKVFRVPILEMEAAQALLGRRLEQTLQVVTMVYLSTKKPETEYSKILGLFQPGYRTTTASH